MSFKESSVYTHPNTRDCHSYVLPSLMRLLPKLEPGLKVLDVGCGNGSVAREFVTKGCRVTGIDLAPSGIETARKGCPEARFELVGADERLLSNLQEDPFDLVYSLEVIEHLYDPEGFLKGCLCALKPGGTFICSTPYHGYLKNLAISLAGGWDKHANPLFDGGHIKFYSEKTFCEAVSRVGFSEISIAGSGRLPWLWKSMILVAKRPGGDA